MFLAALTLGAICVAAWVYLVFAHGGFWKVWRLGSRISPDRFAASNVAVVIPARDEADVIGETIASLLTQTGAVSIRIIVVDDHSSDGTAEAAREAAAIAGRSEALEVIPAEPLPTGWTGKLWAVQQGIDRAIKLKPEYVLLTDADIHHAPDNFASLVAVAEAGGYDLTSFMAKLHCQSVPEKLLIPAFVFFFFMLYPPEWIRDPKRKLAGAAGGCMLIRPGALQRAGGIAAIRDQIIDDCALAKAVKNSGGRVWLGVTPTTFSTRTYDSFGEIERMIARTAFNQLQHSTALLLAAILGLSVTYLFPIVLLASRHAWLVALGGLCWLLMAAAYLPMVRFYELGSIWAFSLPLSASFYLGATVHSALQYWAGRGGTWKGRVQDKAQGIDRHRTAGDL